jgi:hypothetical protein
LVQPTSIAAQSIASVAISNRTKAGLVPTRAQCSPPTRVIAYGEMR